GYGRHRAPQFLVHEIGEAPEEQPERDATGDIIVKAQPVELLLVRQIEDSERGPDHPAMERHAAVPQPQDLDRVPQVVTEIVEQHITETAAEDDPKRGIENQVVGM